MARKNSGQCAGPERGSIVFSRFFFAYFLCSNDKESKDGVRDQ